MLYFTPTSFSAVVVIMECWLSQFNSRLSSNDVFASIMDQGLWRRDHLFTNVLWMFGTHNLKTMLTGETIHRSHHTKIHLGLITRQQKDIKPQSGDNTPEPPHEDTSLGLITRQQKDNKPQYGCVILFEA